MAYIVGHILTLFFEAPAVRSYFMKDGHIAGVEFLKATEDEGRIAEARALFDRKAKPYGAQGFEV